MRSTRCTDSPSLARALGTASSSWTAGWPPRWRRAGTTCPQPSGRPACSSTGRTWSSRRTGTSSPPAPRSRRPRRTRCPSPASRRRASAPRTPPRPCGAAWSWRSRRAVRCRRAGPAGGRLRRAVRRRAGRRVGVPRRLRPLGGRAAGLAPAAPGDADGHDRRRAGARDDPLPGRGGGAAGRGGRDGRAVLAVGDRAPVRRTRAGEPVDEAFAMAADVPEVVAVGVNCVRPRRRRRARVPRRRPERASRPWPTPTAARRGTPSHGPGTVPPPSPRPRCSSGRRPGRGWWVVLPGAARHHRRGRRRRGCAMSTRDLRPTNWAGNVVYSAARSTTRQRAPSCRSWSRQRADARAGHRPLLQRDRRHDGDSVSLAGLPAGRRPGPERQAVTVGARVRYGELAGVPARHGFALPNLGSLPHISVAGACATGTHGSGRTQRRPGHLGLGARLVTADGALAPVSRETDGDELRRQRGRPRVAGHRHDA